MYKESIAGEENTRRYAMPVFWIVIGISSFFYIDILLVGNLCVDIGHSTSLLSTFFYRRFDFRHFSVDISRPHPLAASLTRLILPLLSTFFRFTVVLFSRTFPVRIQIAYVYVFSHA